MNGDGLKTVFTELCLWFVITTISSWLLWMYSEETKYQIFWLPREDTTATPINHPLNWDSFYNSLTANQWAFGDEIFQYNRDNFYRCWSFCCGGCKVLLFGFKLWIFWKISKKCQYLDIASDWDHWLRPETRSEMAEIRLYEELQLWELIQFRWKQVIY